MLPELLPDEGLEPLEPYGLSIIQKKDGFRFGIDAVMLASFVRQKKEARCADLGTGSGIIPLLLHGSGRAASVAALEVQPEYADMAARTVSYNHLEDQISVYCCNVKDVSSHLETHTFDIVTANPPYKEAGSGLIPDQPGKLPARFETEGTLRDFIRCAYYLLKVKGSFYMVHRPERLCDILSFMREERIEPKRLRMIHSYADRAPTLVLVEGQKCALPKLSVLPPLVLYEKGGAYSEEISKMYGEFHYEL